MFYDFLLLDFILIIRDETVEVGADLYELDTEAEATVTAAESSAPTSKPAETSEKPIAAAAAKPASTPKAEKKAEEKSHRTPSIKFLGKEGWARVLSASGGQSVPTLYSIPADYGRPVFTDDEIEALVMGGANLVPDVKNYSSGAQFGY